MVVVWSYEAGKLLQTREGQQLPVRSAIKLQAPVPGVHFRPLAIPTRKFEVAHLLLYGHYIAQNWALGLSLPVCFWFLLAANEMR